MSPPSDRLLRLAFLLSGAAALGYELLWTRLLGLGLGHETLGVYGTLAGYFAGMALGAALLHRRAAEGPAPLRLFITLELAAAAFAALSPLLLHSLAGALPALLGPWAGDNQAPAALALSLVVATLTLLPGTFCLGGTLPALVAVHRRARPGDGGPRTLGRLYSAHTLGATLGVLGTVYLLLPALGFVAAALLLAGLGGSAAAVAYLWGRRHHPAIAITPGTATPPPVIDTSRDPDPDLLRERWPLLALAGGSGLVAIGLELVGLQILSQRLENTIYTFANVLAIYLVGTAIGAAIYQRLAPRAVAGRPATVIALLLLALAGSVVIAAGALGASPAMIAAMIPAGASLGRIAAGELVVAAAVFALPTALMGALFSHVIGLLADGGAGRAYALNTLGSALAPFVFGLVAIPTYGYSDALYLVAYAYLALFLGFCWLRRFANRWLIGGVLGVVLATALGPRSLVLVDLDAEPGWTVVERRETLHGVVTVSQLAAPGDASAAAPAVPLRRLRIGAHFWMGGALAFGERRMGHLPLLLARDPQRVLFLGVGAGATVGAAADFDRATVAHVEAIELVPEILDLLPHFAAINRGIATDDRFHLRAADARRAIAARSPDRPLDLVVGDLFHPGRDGAGNLYTVEHFAAIAARLAPGGLYCQWLPLHQLDPTSLGAIVRAFLEVYPDAHAFLGLYNAATPALALVGARPGERLELDLAAIERRLETTPETTPDLTITEARDLLAAYVLDPQGLGAVAGDHPPNRDLRPQVTFTAPRAAYADDPTLGADNLARILDARVAPTPALLRGDATAVDTLLAATARYRQAQEHYLRGEIARIRRGAAPERLEPSDLPPYLAAYAADPSFPPARGLLYRAAASDPALAVIILPAMLEATPDEPRVYDAFLRYLQQVGDRATFDRVLAEARRRFDPPPPTPPTPAGTAPTEPAAEPAPEPAPGDGT